MPLLYSTKYFMSIVDWDGCGRIGIRLHATLAAPDAFQVRLLYELALLYWPMVRTTLNLAFPVIIWL